MQCSRGKRVWRRGSTSRPPPYHISWFSRASTMKRAEPERKNMTLRLPAEQADELEALRGRRGSASPMPCGRRSPSTSRASARTRRSASVCARCWSAIARSSSGLRAEAARPAAACRVVSATAGRRGFTAPCESIARQSISPRWAIHFTAMGVDGVDGSGGRRGGRRARARCAIRPSPRRRFGR
jgi:hypothetical protein